MAHPMQTMQPGGGGGGGAYQGFQPSSGPMHPSQHTAHYAPHMHRGMPGMQPGMQPGVHAAQRPMMGGGAPPGMMPGVHQPYGPAHNPMAVHSYPQPVYTVRDSILDNTLYFYEKVTLRQSFLRTGLESTVLLSKCDSINMSCVYCIQKASNVYFHFK